MIASSFSLFLYMATAAWAQDFNSGMPMQHQWTTTASTTTTTAAGTPPTIHGWYNSTALHGSTGAIGALAGEPASIATGDLIIYWVQACGGEDSTPTGAGSWTEEHDAESGTSCAATGDVHLSVYWKTAESSSPADSWSDAGDHTMVGAVVIAGETVDTTSPFKVEASSEDSTATAAPTLPGITTTQKGCLAFTAVVFDDDNMVDCTGWDGSWTEVFDDGANAGNDGYMCVATYSLPSAASTGDTTISVSATGTTAKYTFAICE